MLELRGDDVDLGGEAAQRIAVAIVALCHRGRNIGGGRRFLGRIDVAAIAELGRGDAQHAAELPAAEDADRCAGFDHRAAHSGCSATRSEEHTSELQSLMRNSYDVFCLKKKKKKITIVRQL